MSKPPKFRRPVTEDSVEAVTKRVVDSVITEALITSVENPGVCATDVLGNEVSKRKLLSYAQRFGLPASHPDGRSWSSEELCDALKTLVMMPANRDALEQSMRNFAKWWSRADRLPSLEQARKIIRELPGGSDVDKMRRSSYAWQGPFCGPAGGAPPGSFPASNIYQTEAEERDPMIQFAPNPDAIIACAERIGLSGDRSRSVKPGKKRGPSGRKPNWERNVSRERWARWVGRGADADVENLGLLLQEAAAGAKAAPAPEESGLDQLMEAVQEAGEGGGSMFSPRRHQGKRKGGSPGKRQYLQQKAAREAKKRAKRRE